MKTKRRLLRVGIAVGAVLTCSPIIGFLGTGFGIARAFQKLEASAVGDPSHVSAPIGETLIPLIAGMFAGLLGVIVLVVSLFLFRRLRPQESPLP